jgi:hypothetical protein
MQRGFYFLSGSSGRFLDCSREPTVENGLSAQFNSMRKTALCLIPWFRLHVLYDQSGVINVLVKFLPSTWSPSLIFAWQIWIVCKIRFVRIDKLVMAIKQGQNLHFNTQYSFLHPFFSWVISLERFQSPLEHVIMLINCTTKLLLI